MLGINETGTERRPMNRATRITATAVALAGAVGAGFIVLDEAPVRIAANALATSGAATPAVVAVERPRAATIAQQVEPAAAKAREFALPEGSAFNDEGLPVFVPTIAQASAIAPATLAERQALALRKTGVFAPSPGVGFSDHIVSLDEAIDIEALGESIAAIDGEVLRYLPNLRIATVRIPVARADDLLRLDGIGAVADDSAISFMSVPAKNMAKLPAHGTSDYVPVNTSIGVAVIDTGIGDHEDLNIARHVHLTAPATESTTNQRMDAKLEALYLFDEDGGDVVFDRIGSDRQHLYITGSGSNVVRDPASVNWSSLPPIQSSSPLQPFVFKNDTSASVDIHYVTSADGNSTQRYATVAPGQSRSAHAWPKENWIVTPQGSNQRLAVLIDPLGAGQVDYGSTATVAWSDGAMRVVSGEVGSLPDTQIANTCAAANAASIELWFTPADTSSYDNIVVGQNTSGTEHFAIRQYGNRLQARIGIDGGAVYAYSHSGSLVPGRLTHVVLRRHTNGTTRLLIDGADHWNTSINSKTPLAWSGAQTIEPHALVGQPRYARRSLPHVEKR